MGKANFFIGISRHRIGIDGVGVTTLAAFHGCPLRCKYCLNPSCNGPAEKSPYRYTPEELYRVVGVDNLYFIATHGGVCFGGGEPLLRMDFLEEFRALCGRSWALTAETSLHVPQHEVERAAEVFNDFIVDIKDANPDIYRAYTGQDNTLVLSNLRWLLGKMGPEHIIVRIPSIPKFNTAADTDRTFELLTQMGLTRLDRFDYIIREAK